MCAPTRKAHNHYDTLAVQGLARIKRQRGPGARSFIEAFARHIGGRWRPLRRSRRPFVAADR